MPPQNERLKIMKAYYGEIKKGEYGTFLTKRGIILYFRYGYDGKIECWTTKNVRVTGGWKQKTFYREPTKELLNAYEWEK